MSADAHHDLLTQTRAGCEVAGVPPGACVLVAVSAGADSTALACLLAGVAETYPLTLHLGHVDHGWRGPEEAAADAEAVRALGARLDVPVALSAPPPADEPRTEDAARRWRYRQLAAQAREVGATYVATAHHAGDQAETLLMRLLRGSGVVGLRGIPPRRPLSPGDLHVVRPLLGCEPEDLRAWLRAEDIPWREDPTNEDVSRDRAAIRARLAGSRAARHDLVALASRLQQRLAWREARLTEAMAAHEQVFPFSQAVAVDRGWLESLDDMDLALALRLAGRHLDAERDGPWSTRRHRARMRELLGRGGALDLPRDLLMHIAGKRAWLVRRTLDAPTPELRLTDGDTAPSSTPYEAALDADRLGDAPTLRPLETGDRFTPWGRDASGPVEIEAWMRRRGLSRWIRRGQWVLEGDHGIAWVVGLRVDQDHAVTEETRRVARASVLPTRRP